MSITPYAEGIYKDVKREGRQILLRRLTAPGIFFDVTVYSFGTNFRIDSRERIGGADTFGGVSQGDREERISNKEIDANQWPGPPKRGDQIVAEGNTYQVRGVETKIVGGEQVLHILNVRGSGGPR